MKIRSIKYHLKQGGKSVFKNGLMSFASIASVAACAFILIVSLCIVINLDTALEKMEESLGISVYLGEGISDEETKEVLTMLEKIPNISNIQYMSKEDALNWAKEEWGDEQAILEGLEDDNPFPRSFELTIAGAKYQSQVIKDIEKLQKDFEKVLVEKRKKENIEINQILEQASQSSESQTQETTATQNENKNEQSSEEISEEIAIGEKGYEYIGIEKIKHSKKQSEILLTTNNAVRVISIIIILILAMISVAIIVNTIKLTVYVRKNEINIMKYVGATDWFIRWPFVIEGIIIGLIGSLISIIVCMSFYGKVNNLIYENLPIIKEYIEFKGTFEMFLIIGPTTLLLGILLGVIGSANSIKKHLNV